MLDPITLSSVGIYIFFFSNLIYIAGGCVLLLGHAATPEVCIRKLAKKPTLPQREFVAFVNKVPFCEPILASKIDGVWSACTPPIPKLWHLDNKKFDIKLMTQLTP